jgi:hypothetical protein
MASLKPLVALTALPDMDVELAVNRLARNLSLELLGDMGLVEGATKIGAAFGQGRLVSLIDLFGSGRLAMRFGTVVLSWLASGFLGFWLGLALSEGSSLPLASTGRLVESTAEALDLDLEIVDPSLKGLTISTPTRFHRRIMRSSGTCSCTNSRQGIAQLEVGALIKYCVALLRLYPDSITMTLPHLQSLSQLGSGECRGFLTHTYEPTLLHLQNTKRGKSTR